MSTVATNPRCDAILRRIEMTPFLILARAAIIGWTRFAVFPLEITFNAVEGELRRQGVDCEREATQARLARLLPVIHCSAREFEGKS
jgi:hypothetical protein